MNYSKGGCAYLDLTFLTAADLGSLIGGDAVAVSKSVFDNAMSIALCEKPLYAIMPVIATPPAIGGVDYVVMNSPVIADATLVTFNAVINGTLYTLQIAEHTPGVSYSIGIST